eukprot:9795243-Lingulodinium_polyedra.AAC.1
MSGERGDSTAARPKNSCSVKWPPGVPAAARGHKWPPHKARVISRARPNPRARPEPILSQNGREHCARAMHHA